MHHIYHTEGIILGSRNFGEAGRYYSLFTKELGMIYASAQGVRKMSSKLRFVLHDFAYVKVDLVQGKDFWRVTSASKTEILQSITKNKPAFSIFASIADLLKRLLPGTEPNEKLFTDLTNGLVMLERGEDREELQNLEVLIVLRILHNLGYIGTSDSLEELIQSPFLEQNLLLETAKRRGSALSAINRSSPGDSFIEIF